MRQIEIRLSHFIPVPTPTGTQRKARQLTRLQGTLPELIAKVRQYCPQMPSSEVSRAITVCPWHDSTPLGSDHLVTFITIHESETEPCAHKEHARTLAEQED